MVLCSAYKYQKFYKEGKVRAIGVSNFLTHHVEALLADCEVRPAVNQIRFHVGFMEVQKQLIDLCKKENVLVEGYMPFCVGKCLTNSFVINTASKYGVSPAQLCIRYIMQHGIVPLPKAMSEGHIIDNVNVFAFEISDEDMMALDNLSNFTDPLANIDNIQNELSYFVNRRK